jgi:bacillithiol biosynthesis deacetylase BshB1
MIDVCCIGAHPDDVEIAMGGTVARLVARGVRVGLVDLTDGEPTPHGTREIRLREADSAARVLGVSWRRTLDLPNRSLADTTEARRMVAEVLRAERPRTIFTHYWHDGHPDHVAACTLVEAARFWGKLVKTDMAGSPHLAERIIHFPAVHYRLAERPAFIVDISAELDQKMAAVGCYASQFQHNPANASFLEQIETSARYFGGLARTKAGEPFFTREVPRITHVEHLV